MPQPPAYDRLKDFTENFGSETDHSALNAELDRASNSINDIRTNLAVLQADDGKLRPDVVTPDSISPELRADLVNRVVLDSQQLLADAQAAANTATAGANTATAKAAEAVVSASTASAKEAQATISADGAADSAGIAATKRDEAVAARDAAVGARDTAVGAANTAVTKRDEAVAAAGTATTKRDEAIEARDTAVTKRDEAVGARDTAVTKAGEAAASAAAAANSALNASSMTAVKGLRGNVNAASPLTKFDLSADEVVLRDANGNTVKRHNTGLLTVDLGLAGPIANGRAQAPAFGANSWIHLYFIFNPTTATLALTASHDVMGGPHTAAPVMQNGFTHWCYATTVLWNASSNIVDCFVRGSALFWRAVFVVLSGGGATTETAVSLDSVLPPSAASFLYTFAGALSTNATGGAASILVARIASGADLVKVTVATVAASQRGANTVAGELPNVGRSLLYQWYSETSPANISLRQAYLEIIGFKVHNGDS